MTAAEGATWTITKIEKSYEARALLVFLEHVPDRRRAEEAFARIGQLVRERKLVELDPTAPGRCIGRSTTLVRRTAWRARCSRTK